MLTELERRFLGNVDFRNTGLEHAFMRVDGGQIEEIKGNDKDVEAYSLLQLFASGRIETVHNHTQEQLPSYADVFSLLFMESVKRVSVVLPSGKVYVLTRNGNTGQLSRISRLKESEVSARASQLKREIVSRGELFKGVWLHYTEEHGRDYPRLQAVAKAHKFDVEVIQTGPKDWMRKASEPTGRFVPVFAKQGEGEYQVLFRINLDAFLFERGVYDSLLEFVCYLAVSYEEAKYKSVLHRQYPADGEKYSFGALPFPKVKRFLLFELLKLGSADLAGLARVTSGSIPGIKTSKGLPFTPDSKIFLNNVYAAVLGAGSMDELLLKLKPLTGRLQLLAKGQKKVTLSVGKPASEGVGKGWHKHSKDHAAAAKGRLNEL